MSKISIYIILILFYVSIPILILFNNFLFKYKFLIMVVFALVSYVILRLIGVKNQELGISTNNLWQSIKIILPITIFFAILSVIAYKMGWSRFNPTETFGFYIFYVFVSSPTQEFLYRGMLNYFGKTFNLPVWSIIILSSLLFALVHIIYKDYVLIIATFFLGLVWHYLYLKSNNLVGISISHAVVGLLTIFLGLI